MRQETLKKLLELFLENPQILNAYGDKKKEYLDEINKEIGETNGKNK